MAFTKRVQAWLIRVGIMSPPKEEEVEESNITDERKKSMLKMRYLMLRRPGGGVRPYILRLPIFKVTIAFFIMLPTLLECLL